MTLRPAKPGCHGACLRTRQTAITGFSDGHGYCSTCRVYVRPAWTGKTGRRPLCPCCRNQVRMRSRWARSRHVPRVDPTRAPK